MKLVAARGAQKTREDSKKLQMYSKQWLPGDTMRLFLPVFNLDGQWHIAVGAIWGHSVNDFDGIGLKTAFIPSLTEFDENGDPVGPPDVTWQFSQIAKVFTDGQKRLEEQHIQQKKWPNEAARTEALRKLEEKYDTKNNLNAIKPAISRATYYISTECLCLKYQNDQPVIDTLKVVSMPLSNQRIDELYAILGDAKYGPVEGEEFIEIEWKYAANPDKGASGRASHPSGLTRDYRIETKHPDAYKTISGMFNMISHDADSIARRATKRVDEAKIRGALTQYSYMNSEYLDACSEEDEETLLRSAKLIHEMDITKALANMELIEKLNAEIANIKAEVTPDSIPDLGAPTNNNVGSFGAAQNVDLGAATNIGGAAPDLGAAAGLGAAAPDLGTATAQPVKVPDVTGAPTMNSLLNNPNLSDMTEQQMENIDLGMM